MTTITKDMVSVRLVNALDRTWTHIRKHHPDVPPVVITVGSGMTDPKRPKLGHFAASRWEYQHKHVSELFIAGEGLQHGPTDVLVTLLHEAAHGIAVTRGIKDTSRQGRYHNTRFKQLAEELGLEVTEQHSIGWSGTTVSKRTLKIYRRYLGVLERALVIWRRQETARETTKNNHNGLSLTCLCERRIRVSTKTHDEGPITCGNCETDFQSTD